jgi:hypothetical protein
MLFFMLSLSIKVMFFLTKNIQESLTLESTQTIEQVFIVMSFISIIFKTKIIFNSKKSNSQFQ